ncbi:MAG: hypothetical protein KAS17_02490 [Victivallaceae bacterium]|nr:hypothetical protein [Victivallaceae bacterium]
MKKLQILFTILLFSSVVYAVEKHKEVVSYRLDSKRVFPIATYFKKGVTTVMFPGQIEGIAAGNVAINKVHHKIDGSPVCDFLVSFQPGNYYFSIRALKNGVSGTVNVVYARNTYIIKLLENENNAMSTVSFSDDGENGLDSERDFRPPSTAVLKGLLDKAKSFDMLKKKYPGAVSQVQVCNNKCISDYEDYTATILKCWRFNNYNSLVFLVEFKNKTNKTLRYKPYRTVFSVFDQHLYPAAIETTGVIPSNSTTLAFFVVSNTTDGRKNKFSANNDWEVIIKTIQEKAQ